MSYFKNELSKKAIIWFRDSFRVFSGAFRIATIWEPRLTSARCPWVAILSVNSYSSGGFKKKMEWFSSIISLFPCTVS